METEGGEKQIDGVTPVGMDERATPLPIHLINHLPMLR
jgi:hypothetical protein